MNQFLVIVREPDGRLEPHTPEETAAHRKNMTAWFEKHGKAGHIGGGSALALSGKQIKGKEAEVVDEIHKVGTEILGGYIILKAQDLDEAVAIMRTFPIYEVDGYVEVRELMKTD